MKQYLKHKFYSFDLEEEITIKSYFKYLLKRVWNEGERFRAKDISGQYDLTRELIKLGLVIGKLDENEAYGYSYNEVDKIVTALIEEM